MTTLRTAVVQQAFGPDRDENVAHTVTSARARPFPASTLPSLFPARSLIDSPKLPGSARW